ncbi:hypothetical protein K9M48_00625 [Candidatus Gracilibacteria bacterium]|nr:hypothetical protein [Candidatus Gracilibacteria bacterium]
MKTFTTLFYLGLTNQHLTKETGLIGYYMYKRFGYKSKIITPEIKGEEYPEAKFINGVEIVSKKGFKIGLIHFGLIGYLLKNSKKTDILNLFHFSLPSLFYGLIYKLLNKRGFIYLKLDYNINLFKDNGYKIYNINPIINVISTPFENLLINICNIISVEAEEGENLLKNYNKRFEKNLICMPNGADDINIKNAIGHINSFQEKENLIITVGRNGTYQKNTEMLLNIISNTNLKNWKIKIIGSIDNVFIEKIKKFFKEYPHFKTIVEFTGPKTKK